MKTLVILAVAFVAISFASCDNKKSAETQEPETELVPNDTISDATANPEGTDSVKPEEAANADNADKAANPEKADNAK